MSMATSITELDLRKCKCHHVTLVERVTAVPGLKTSTAFLTFLRANLVLPESSLAASAPTPLFAPLPSLPALAPSSMDASAAPAPDDIQPFFLEILTRDDDKVDALHLVADSIAQQRQIASLHLVFHPLLLSGLALAVGITYHCTWSIRHDLSLSMTLTSGIIMTYLMAIRYYASRYVEIAEKFNWDWLSAERSAGLDDLILGARLGEQLVGALVLRLQPNMPVTVSRGKKHSRNPSLRGGRGVIRAWTTKLRYRGQGVGRDLLHEAVRVTREKCGRDAEVGFAREHANCRMVLAGMFNGPFRKGERRAAKALERVLEEWEGNRRVRCL